MFDELFPRNNIIKHYFQAKRCIYISILDEWADQEFVYEY